MEMFLFRLDFDNSYIEQYKRGKRELLLSGMSRQVLSVLTSDRSHNSGAFHFPIIPRMSPITNLRWDRL